MYKKAQQHFKKADPILHKASLLHDIDDVRPSPDLFYDIARAIVSQQLSGKAADTIFARLEIIVGRNNFTPERIVLLDEGDLRSAGLSQAKVNGLKALAEAVMSEKLDLEGIHALGDEGVIETLTTVKGIGPWTAEMILMFSLGRADIFSMGDLGLKKGIMHLYGLKKMPSERTMKALMKKWSPYNTYASRILWRVADGQKMQNAKLKMKN